MKEDKKMKFEARKAGFQALRDDMKDLMKEEGLGHFSKLKPQKLMKVTVAAPDEDSLKKGLSKAEQILKAKMGDEMLPEKSSDESMEEPMSEEASEEMCEQCQGAGCPECEEEMLEEKSEQPEDLKAKIAELEKQLAELRK